MSPTAAAALSAPSAAAVSKSTSTHEALDRAVADVRAAAAEFARLPVAEKAKLVRALIPGIVAVSKEWVRAGCRAKGLDSGSVEAAEEWLGGVGPTLRNARLLAESLEAIAAHGKPPLGQVGDHAPRRPHHRAGVSLERDRRAVVRGLHGGRLARARHRCRQGPRAASVVLL